MYWGKIIGAVVGFGLGHGFLGAAAGVAVGHWVDLRLAAAKPVDGTVLSTQQERQRVFSTAVVSLAAKLAKIDGPVNREEVDAFKAEFIIPASQRSGIAALFDEAKRYAGDYEAHAERLARAFAGESAILSELLDVLHRIALADGPLSPPEKTFLSRVATLFGFPGRGFAGRQDGIIDADPYRVLGVSPDAPMTDIKAAWRRLTREHHPDTLMAKGIPADHIDFATRKMASINAAYDRIRAQRGEA
jgi:DnaJ like chaperone protein